ncbi:MAG: hypothetical protein H7138_03815, partial [Myxococcales bacterium]|nr:hypothetical protein [Myxococcales bacterium]
MIRVAARALVIVMAIAASGCPDRSSKGVTMESTHQNPPVPLPTEGSSPAALLSATHLFVVSVRSVAGPAWSDTVFERDLRLELVVREILKGTLDGGAEAHVSLTVRQRQPPEGGYQGIWSHVQPAPAAGVSYLVIARGAATDPAALLIEPALRQLVPA